MWPDLVGIELGMSVLSIAIVAEIMRFTYFHYTMGDWCIVNIAVFNFRCEDHMVKLSASCGLFDRSAILQIWIHG